jgi:Tfp pilus assembly protein PilF
MRKYLLLHVLIISFVFLLIIPLILLTLLPAVSLADADRIFKENSKAVVVVTAYDEKGNAISQGSGFIVRADGAVVTNYHVIGMARDIKITAGDRILDVEGLIFTDEKNDLVILKAKVKNMPVVKLGVVEKANIGEHVYVISSPEGLENTISDGLLSGIREIDEKREILQITAPISPGSSGGAVFNRNGEVIGVVTFLIKEAQNLNFAMPVELIKDKISSKMVTAIKGSGLEDYEKTVEYWFVIGTMYFNLGMNKEAIDAFKQAIKIDPDNADAHYNLGTAFIKSGMYKEAIEAYKQVIRIKPDYAEAHNNLGTAFIKSGMDKEAIEAYKQAIRINPDDANAHYYLGVIYALLNDKVSALEQYKILKSLDSELANKLFNLIYE